MPDLEISPAVATATTVILIPAYEPDHKLVDLVRSIRATDPHQTIVIVNDGSAAEYDAVFRAARVWGCDVIGHLPNRGKGHALKRGFEHVAHRYPGADVVCADCDGQHSLVDIRRVAEAVRTHQDQMVLGARQFLGDVPSRSRFGNDVTRTVFQFATGLRLQDTQTGLRGYAAAMLPWLQTVSGERFEYELNALLEAKRAGIGFYEVPIETIYLAGNESSHFRTVRDSVRVYVPFVKFSLSSFTAFGVDFVLFLAFMGLTGWLLASVVFARLISATVNFLANHRYVFSAADVRRRSAAGPYALLVVSLLAANYGLLRLMTGTLGVGLVAAKLLTEATLFVVSYQLQRRFVFASQLRPVDAPVSDLRRHEAAHR